MSIFSFFASTGLSIIGWLIKKSAASAEAKKAFLDFYRQYEQLESQSLRQASDLKKQLDELKDKRTKKVTKKKVSKKK